MKSLIIFIVLTASLLSAAQPHAINFQGILTNPDGSVVADTTYSFLFSLFDADVAGNKLWSETQVVATQGGVYQVTLGSVSSLELLPFNQPYYVQIAVNSTALPLRTKLVTTPYAISANRADIALTAMRADTASFASTAATAGSAAVAGRASLADTATFATSAGSAITAMTAGSAATASIAAKADTANFALVALSTVSGTADSALIAASAHVAQSLSTGAAVLSINGLTDGIVIKSDDGAIEVETNEHNEIIIKSDPFAHGVKIDGPCTEEARGGLHTLDDWDICIDPTDKDLYLFKGLAGKSDFVILGQAAYVRARTDTWDSAATITLTNRDQIELNTAQLLVNENTIETNEDAIEFLSSADAAQNSQLNTHSLALTSVSSNDAIQDQSLSALSSADGAMTTRIVTNENAISDLVGAIPVLEGKISDNTAALIDSVLELKAIDIQLQSQISVNNLKVSSPLVLKNGNFGLGTNDPLYYLDIKKDRNQSNQMLQLSNQFDGDNSAASLALRGFGNNLVLRSHGTSDAQYPSTNIIGSTSGTGSLMFMTNTLPRMNIDVDGNVGIGTGLDTPEAVLHVKGALKVDGDIEITGTVKASNPGNVYTISGTDSLYLLYDVAEMGYSSYHNYPNPNLYILFHCGNNLTSASVQIIGSYHNNYYFGKGVVLYKIGNSTFTLYYSGSKVYLEVTGSLYKGSRDLTIHSSLPIVPRAVTDIPTTTTFPVLNL